MTLQQEMEAFGEVMPERKAKNSSTRSPSKDENSSTSKSDDVSPDTW